MSTILGFVLAGGRGERLGVITKHRSKAAVPFGGRYRIIDFTLSNCVNSRIHTVHVATQYAPRSLQDHVRLGRPWDLDRRDGGLLLLQPYTGREDSFWYRGTSDALYRNLDMIASANPKHILVLSGDQIYRMDYGAMIRHHRSNAAQITLAVKAVDPSDSHRYGMVDLDGARVKRFEEKPAHTDMHFANLGIYLFELDYLLEALHSTVPNDRFDLVWDVVMPAVQKSEVAGHVFEGFWEDVGELDAYYHASRSLLPAASGYLWDRRWPVYTRSEERPPARFGTQARVSNSVVANGCRVFGRVERSILFPGVLVGEGAMVQDSILFSGTQVHRGSLVTRAILDKRVVVADEARIGCDTALACQLAPTRSGEARVDTREGLTVVGKHTRIPAHFECTRPIMIDSYTAEEQVRREVEAASR